MACERFDFNDEGDNCLAIRVGFDYRVTITYTDSDGNAIDLTGSTLTMTIKASREDVSPTLTLTNSATLTVSGLYIADATTGIFVINIINADTGALAEGTYGYEISIVDSASVKTLFMEGSITATTGVL